jgi:anti-anti-sigma factor
LAVTMERKENHLQIRLEGELTVAAADELKESLMEALASRGGFELDLKRTETIDIAVMQVLWAAGREAERQGAKFAIHTSEAASAAARNAGFECFPGQGR